jgi:DNA invertase Pin-like site-specific DNA recombinase
MLHPAHKGILVGYARTSTADQKTGLHAQVRDLQAAGCTKIFQERVSSIAQRAELKRALDYVRCRDTLVVTKVDRLARSTVGLWEIVKRLEALGDGGPGLRVLNLGGETVDTKCATGKLVLTIFAGFAQFEREMMLERQREGIAKAKAENRYLGRRPSARLKADEAVKLFKTGRTVTQIADALGIGRGSVYRALEACGIKQPASAASGSTKTQPSATG